MHSINMKRSNSLFCGCLILFFLPSVAFAQPLVGRHTGNYAGLYRATFNPSAIVGTRYRFQINLVSFNATVNNRYFKYFRSDALFHPFRNAYATNDMYGKSKLTGSFTEVPNVNVLAELRTPSAFLAFGRKQQFAVGVQTRLRGFVQGTGVPSIVSEVYTKRLDFGNVKASSGSFRDFTVGQQTFFETALTAAAMPINIPGIVKVKVGGSIKRLSAGRNVFLKINSANYNVRVLNADESEMDWSNVNYEYGYTNAVESFGLGALFSSKYGSGLAYDLGATVELGRIRQHQPYRSNYILRLGAALTDVGSIAYPANAGRIYRGTLAKTTFDQEKIIALGNDPIKALEATFPKTNARAYDLTTSLPQTLNLDVDFHFAKSFFINASYSKSQPAAGLPGGIQQPDMLILTPRFEDEDAEFTLPVTWIAGNSSPMVGLSLRLGPVFIGFNNFSGLLNIHAPRATMVYFGVNLWKLNKTEESKN
jgi:Family of unknown function (DUF5723)